MTEIPVPSRWETPEFYQANQQAAEIRLACIPILQKIRALLYDDDLVHDQLTRSNIYAQLEQENGILIQMGVFSGMDSGKELRDYQKDPLLAARFLAGQLLQLTGTAIPAMLEASQSIGENTALVEKAVVVESADMSPYSREFAVVQQMYNFIKQAFALSDKDIGR